MAEKEVFVGRGRELDQLDGFLKPALAGRGGVCFVAGEAGSGKTALVTEFARRAQEREEKLLVAVGRSDAQTGIGDPYLPFREASAMLTGDASVVGAASRIGPQNVRRLRAGLARSAQVLVEAAPELVGVLVPGGKLLGEVGKAVVDKVGWMDKLELLARKREAPSVEQNRIFEQYTAYLQRLSTKTPLILFLDDLQWSDAASVGLLFHLGRRIGESHILIVGAYRPEEVAVGRAGERHPLEKVLAEFMRYFGDVWVDLDQAEEAERRQFVDAILQTEPNRLGEGFRKALFQHTGGHALFTVELLRNMQERRDIVRDGEGYWTESSSLDWGEVPARVEGVIEERIGRLEEELREILSVASVEGQDFTAQVVGRVEVIEERQLLRELSQELEKRHRLVQERGEVQVGRGRLLSRYQFAHTLIQQYLYNGLGAGERRLLHSEVAGVLEELYEGHTEEIAVQLARHFELAGIDGKAIKYLLEAGDRARSLYAHQEAIDYYQRALALLKESGESEEAARTLMKLGLVYTAAFQPDNAQGAYKEAFALWVPLRESTEAAELPARAAVLRFAIGEPLTLDPGRIGDDISHFMTVQLFEGLVEIDADYNVLPAVAATWEVADGGRRYLFRIQEGLRWSDGAALTAADFEYAWKRNLSSRSPVAHLLYVLENARALAEGEISDPDMVGVTALDDLTLEMRLEEPTAYLPFLLAHPVAYPLPRWAVERHGVAWTEPQNLLSNGAYQLVEWRRGERMVLSRSPFYRGAFPGNAELVRCQVFTDFGPVLEAYAAGDLDAISMINADPGTVARALVLQGDELLFTPQPSTYFLVFLVDRPPFDDVRIRRAFVHAVDREALVRDVSKGQYLPATGGFVPPGMPGHTPGIGLAYNPKLARNLLAQAGYPEGRGFPGVSWIHLVGLAGEPMVPFLQRSWRENLGLALEAESLEWESLMERLVRDPAHLTLLGWLADYPDPDAFLRVTFHSTEGNNDPRWHDARFDSLVEEAARVADQATRLELYREADRILVAEEAVVMPLGYARGRILAKPWVTVPRVPPALMRLKSIILQQK
jgi:ABC-type oligopeptide transport system substrate-binding subunit